MCPRNYPFIFAVIGLGLCSVFFSALGACDWKLCPGPAYYYQELGCKPIFENATSCCPTRYNCAVWKNLPREKCYVNGHRYKTGDVLPAEYTSDPCFHCRCYGNLFTCTMPSCVSDRDNKPGCRYEYSSLECCTVYEICDDSPVACTVDGKSYKLGESFHPVAEPEKTCYCKKGYNGTNDDRYCVWRKPSWCDNVIRYIDNIRKDCPPVYRKNSALYKDCNRGHICPETESSQVDNTPDNTREPSSGTIESTDPKPQCKFGNSFMKLGDTIIANQKWGGSVNCTCEVPPIPTCYEMEEYLDGVSEIQA